MPSAHNIEALSFEKDFICLQIDGTEFKISIKRILKKLEVANETRRNQFTISPSGYGIHWPLIDEDLSVDNILKVA